MARLMHRVVFCIAFTLVTLGMKGASAQSFREEAQAAAIKGDNELAVTLYEKAFFSAEKAFKEEDIELAIRRAELGEAYRAVGRWQDAIKYLSEAWNWARTKAEERHQWAGHEGDLAMNCAEKLARSYQGNGMYEDAIITLRKGVEDNEKAARRSEEKVQLLAMLTDTFLLLDRDKDAGLTANKAMELTEQTTAEDPVRTARVTAVFGDIYFSHDRIDQARLLLQSAVRLSAQHLPPDDSTRIRIQQQLGEIFVREGRLDEAGFLLDDARSNIMRSKTQDPKLLIALNLSKADLELKKKQPEEALKVAIENRRLCETHLLPEHPDLGRSLLREGLAYAQLKRKQKAREALTEAHKLLEISLGEHHPETLEAQAILRSLP